MEQNYCVYCMNPTSEDLCSVCGKNRKEYEPAPHHLKPGTILSGKYLVGAVLGEGGFGITYIGHEINLDIKVAIKEYFPSGIVNRNNTSSTEISAYIGDAQAFFEKGKNSFLSEARTLAKFCNEKSIVSVRDFFSENNTAYIVMEYLEGIDLRDYLNQHGKMSFEQTVTMLTPLMVALSKIHAQGLIHRDISPANIMILKDGSVKLLDFGAVREVGGADEKSLSILLKPGYAPEEQYRTKGHQGPWTDVYALSATMYKMMTGVTPIDAMNRVFSDDLEKITGLNPGVTSEQEAIILKGMAVQQANRYQTIDELCADCQAGAVRRRSVEKKADESTESGGLVNGLQKNGQTHQNDKADSTNDKTIKEEKKKNNFRKGDNSLASKKRLFLKLCGGIAAAAVVILIVGIVFTRMNTVTIGDHNIARDATSVRISSDIINDNDLQKLNKLKNLESLEIINCFLDNADVETIAELTWLKKLSLSGNTDITDVSPLNSLINLTHLDISVTNTSDISCLNNLVNLETLNISDTKVADLNSIGKYTKLSMLFMDSVDGLDISTVTVPSTLCELHCCGNEIESLEFVSGSDSLEILYADNNNISDLSPLSEYDLIKIYLSANNITDLSPLSIQSIEYELDVSTNAIEDISCLKDIPVASLDLGYNQISDISALTENYELREVKLNNNQITDISPLKDCFHIYSLNISYNQIADITALTTIDDLERFKARGNKIVDITPLASCKLLIEKSSELDLRDNRITNVGVLAGYVNTKWMYLSGNEIKDVSPLASCTALETLSLNNNQLSDISVLSSLGSLHRIEAVNNPITNADSLPVAAPDENVRGDLYLLVSYHEGIDFAELAEIENLNIIIYDVPGERQKDALEELEFRKFRDSTELDEVEANEDIAEETDMEDTDG